MMDIMDMCHPSLHSNSPAAMLLAPKKVRTMVSCNYQTLGSRRPPPEVSVETKWLKSSTWCDVSMYSCSYRFALTAVASAVCRCGGSRAERPLPASIRRITAASTASISGVSFEASWMGRAVRDTQEGGSHETWNWWENRKYNQY